jgi:uncharacterized protein (TIGR03118 family)
MLKKRHGLLCLMTLIIFAALPTNPSAAQSTTYRVTPLASKGAGANHQSSNLLNPWGIAFLPGQGFWISENAAGRVDAYDADGNALGGLTIPAPSGSYATFSKPTGIVADPESNFGRPGANFQYLVAADNGTIWGFREVNGAPPEAEIFVDNVAAAGSSYTGIAVLHPDCCAPYVAAANFSKGIIDTYVGVNTLVSLSRNQFTDPNLPAGYSPYNIQKIGDQVFVTYAQQDASHLPVTNPGAGLIDIFDLEANFVKRFVSPGGALNAPWGIAQAPSNFGPFSAAFLVGNLGDGNINAFDDGGNYLGTLKDAGGSPLSLVGLHGLAVRSDGGGDPNALYEVGGALLGQAPEGTFGAVTTTLETTITLSAPAAAVAGTAVTLTAHTVSAVGTPAGIVTFFDGANVIGQQGLDSTGTASITISSFGVGSHSITAEYVGSFDNSVSGAVSLTVTASTTTSRYHLAPILSDLPGLPIGGNPLFKNPWGLTFVPAGPFWAADNESSNTSVFDETGAEQLPATIRVERSDFSGAKPTGIAYNPYAAVNNGDFTLPDGTPGQILLSTEDGIIAGWGTVNGEILQVAPIARDDSAAGAVYKGIAIVNPIVRRSYLALPDFHNARVQTYDAMFSPLTLPGNFVDPGLPTGYAPFNVQQIGDRVFVTYAVQDTAKHDPVDGAGNGIVDVFDVLGHFVSRFVSNGVLNEPWGIVQASANFGDYSSDILIANHGDSTINAFDPVTGNYAGTLTDEDGQTLNVFGTWGLTFRSDNGTVDPNTLFFTDGENQGADGLFGSITVAGSPANTPSMVALSFNGDISPTGSFFIIADVTAVSGTPTGAVSYFDGTTPLGSAPVINGRASFIPTVFFDAGTHSITARYSGDATFLLSKVTASLTVPGFADTVTFSAPANAVLGAVVTLKANVTAPHGMPTGTVSFQDGNNTLGTANLDTSGMASLTISTLAAGTHNIIASYGGDILFQPNASQPASITIAPPPLPVSMPVVGSLAPISVKPTGNGFALTVNGSGFVTNSIVMFNGNARSTTFVSSTQLTAAIPATDIATSGVATVQVTNPSPGGPSGTEAFAIDTATNTLAVLVQPALTLTAGQSANATAQLNGFTGTVTAQCLNAPAGLTCTFNQSTGAVTLQSSSNTPKGTFVLTVVFTGQTAVTAQQTGTISASLMAVPGLLFGGLLLVRNSRNSTTLLWLVPFALLLTMAVTGCNGGKMPPAPVPPATQPAQASTGLSVTVQ